MGSLSSTQHEILIGSLLGDGTLRKQGSRTNALLEVNHSVAHKDYVDWKYRHFQSYVLTPPKCRSGNGQRVAYRFTTRSLPIITTYFRKFYDGRRKHVPRDIRLTPLSLAVWFMDDGSKSRSSFYLNSQQFSDDDQHFLQERLQTDLGLVTSLNKDKEYWRIRVSTDSSRRMNALIRSYVFPCFRYKLLDDPVTTDSKDEILITDQDNTPTPALPT